MATAPKRPFIDTNILFSGFYNPSNPPGRLLTAHAEGRITIVLSSQILEELVRTIRAKKPDLLPALQRFLTAVPPELCADPTVDAVRQARTWINANDAPILAAAMASGADCLVTGNTRHFTPEVARRARIRIVSAADYVAELAELG